MSHPAIRAVLDAGAASAEGEGAASFVALEPIEAPSQTLDAFLASAPDLTARARVGSELLGAASTLAHHRLPLPEARVVIDGDGQPKRLGLEDATAGVTELDARIPSLATRLLPEHATRNDIEAIARDVAKMPRARPPRSPAMRPRASKHSPPRRAVGRRRSPA